jgi:hypothetical protein
MAACEKVFNTVELLDMILLYTLPPNDSKVYCNWGAVKPVEPNRTLLLQRGNKTFYNHINGDTEIARALHLVPGGKSTIRVHVRQRYPQLFNMLPPNLDADWTCNAYVRIPFSRTQLNRQLNSKPWSNLQLFRPPITKLGMVVTDGTGMTHLGVTPPPYKQGIVVRETGLTVKDVVEAGKTYLDNAPKHPCYSGVVFFARLDENGEELVDLDPRAYNEALCARRVK